MRVPPHLAVALLALAVALPAAGAAPPLEKGALTRAYAERLRAALPHAKVEVRADLEVRWSVPGGPEHTAFLDNAWKELQGDPGRQEAVLERLVGLATEVAAGGDRAVQPGRIVPVVKDAGWLEATRRALREGGAKDVSAVGEVREDYNGALTILYAEDSERGIGYLTAEELRRTGVARSELRALAVRNLRGLLPPVDLQGRDGLYMLTAGGDYEASLILFEELWNGPSIAPKVKGEIVIALPARDLVLVTGSEDAAGLRKVKALAAKVLKEGAYTLTDELFVWRGGRFVPFRPRR